MTNNYALAFQQTLLELKKKGHKTVTRAQMKEWLQTTEPILDEDRTIVYDLDKLQGLEKVVELNKEK
jgi:hypothetical protein